MGWPGINAFTGPRAHAKLTTAGSGPTASGPLPGSLVAEASGQLSFTKSPANKLMCFSGGRPGADLGEVVDRERAAA